MTSLAFMFDEVPEPVWKTSIGNWLSCSPAAMASAAVAIASATAGSSRPSREFAADADRVVVRDQEPGPAEHAQLRVGQEVERLLGRLERVQRILVGPEEQRRGGDPRVRVEQLAARADLVGAREPRPRAGEVRVAADVGERVADQVAGRRVPARAELHAEVGPERAP